MTWEPNQYQRPVPPPKKVTKLLFCPCEAVFVQTTGNAKGVKCPKCNRQMHIAAEMNI